MNEELFKSFTEQTKRMFAPLQRYNQVMIDNLEKVTEYQLNTLKNYSDLGLQQLKLVSHLDDSAELSDLGSQQIEWFNTLSKSILEDAQRMAELGSEIKDNIESMVRESIEPVTESSSKATASTKPKAPKQP